MGCKNKEVELSSCENFAFFKCKDSASYCRCSAISLFPDISHINHFSQIDTEQDAALLHHSIGDEQENDDSTPLLPAFRWASYQTNIKKGATHEPLLYLLS